MTPDQLKKLYKNTRAGMANIEMDDVFSENGHHTGSYHYLPFDVLCNSLGYGLVEDMPWHTMILNSDSGIKQFQVLYKHEGIDILVGYFDWQGNMPWLTSVTGICQYLTETEREILNVLAPLIPTDVPDSALLSPAIVDLIERRLQEAGIPLAPPAIPTEDWLETCAVCHGNFPSSSDLLQIVRSKRALVCRQCTEELTQVNEGLPTAHTESEQAVYESGVFFLCPECGGSSFNILSCGSLVCSSVTELSRQRGRNFGCGHAAPLPEAPPEPEKDTQTVKLTYFKESGKYYTSGEYESEKEGIHGIWDEVEEMMKEGKRPGLVDGHGDFDVLVELPGHEHDHPILMKGIA